MSGAVEIHETDQQKQEDFAGVYWMMLMSLEGKVDPSKNSPDKETVEAAYRAWNRMYPEKQEIHPRWMEDKKDRRPEQ